MIGIYKIVSPSNKIYIGQSWDLNRRFKEYFKKGCKSQSKLFNSLTKYGVKNHKFEILIELREGITQEYLDRYEMYYFEYYRNKKIELLNLKEPGGRGKHSEETKLKISKSKINPSIETRKKHSSWIRTKEYKDKLSKSLIGKKKMKKKTKEVIENLRKKLIGRKLSDETKTKISLACRGKKQKLIKCPHCGKEGGNTMRRYHFDNCKNKLPDLK